MADQTQRVTISLPPAAVKFLREEAGRTGLSMADVVRQSIANTQYLQQAHKSGADILISEPGKPTSRLVFR